MSKFTEMSDIHLEFFYKSSILNDWNFPNDAEYLLLSGDATVAAFLRPQRTDKKSLIVQNTTKAFFEKANNHFKKVFYIFGNHEHYHGEYHNSYTIMREFLKDYQNVVLMERDVYELDDCVVMGTTLWTSFDNNDPVKKLLAQRDMNDYHLCRFRDDDGFEFRMLPDNTYNEHLLSVEWLKKSLEKYKDKKVVVMTHHAPLKQSTHPKYLHDANMNSCYSSDLSNLFTPNIKLWVHGHTHHSFNYMFGDTNVVCNPHGYFDTEDLNMYFDPNLVIVV